MKRFIVLLFIFLIPIVFFITFIFCYPINKRFAYAYIAKDSYNRSLWLYDRINYNSTPIDVAFIGTSHTVHAVNDSVVQSQLLKLFSIKSHLANLGYYRTGRNMNYVIIKELLKRRTVKSIVLEFSEDEDISSNLDFGYAADVSDVIQPPHFNQSYFYDSYKSFNVHLSYIRYKLKLENDTIGGYQPKVYGYGGSTQMADIKKLKLRPDNNITNYFGRSLNILYPRAYLCEIANLCKAKRVKLYFLYLPRYTNCSNPPMELETYKKYGTILIPPHSIFNNANNFMDEAHLNNNGADRITDYLLTRPEIFSY